MQAILSSMNGPVKTLIQKPKKAFTLFYRTSLCLHPYIPVSTDRFSFLLEFNWLGFVLVCILLLIEQHIQESLFHSLQMWEDEGELQNTDLFKQ